MKQLEKKADDLQEEVWRVESLERCTGLYLEKKRQFMEATQDRRKNIIANLRAIQKYVLVCFSIYY